MILSLITDSNTLHKLTVRLTVTAPHSRGPPFPGRALELGLGLGLGGPREWQTPGMADPGNGGPESDSQARIYMDWTSVPS